VTINPPRQPNAATLRQPCHFGEWLQGRMGPDGPVALITLRPEGLALTAGVKPSPRLSVKTVHATSGFPVSHLRLLSFLRALNLSTKGAYNLRLACPPGLGTGASTASLIAIARLAGYQGTAQRLALACIAAEGASDPLMFAKPDRLLWASRQGRVLQRMPALPYAHLITGFVGPALPTNPEDQDYDDITDLVAGWSKAQNLPAFAALAKESARRCIARRGPVADPTEVLAKELGALGWTTSHSGAARTLIFAPGTVPETGAMALREAGFYGVQLRKTGGAA
jgi:uncharacterized protein involved in propanediol utilization